MYQYLTKKDLDEGTEIAKMLEDLDEVSLKMVLVYAGALRDRKLVDGDVRTA